MKSGIEVDLGILKIIGQHVDGLVESLVLGGAPLKTMRRWLVGYRDPPGEMEALAGLMALAADLELFTPSMSGRTDVDRFLQSRRPATETERHAFEALGGAQFRLVRIVGRDGPAVVRLLDLATRENLPLLNPNISPLAEGASMAMRLCPLPSGRQVLISPLFVLDEAALGLAMGFVRPGKPLGLGHRCATNLYRDIARRGLRAIPMAIAPVAGAAPRPAEVPEDLSEIQRLTLRWLKADGPEDQASLTAETRRLANLDNLVDACGCFGVASAAGQEKTKQVLARIAAILIETLSQRGRAGVGGYADILDRAAASIAGHIAAGDMYAPAATLFERLRARWAPGDPPGQKAPGQETKAHGAADRVELDRVFQRILALRAKTVDRGCTQEEAMAAAAKVAELLGRYDLSLDEVGVRKSACIGAAVETSRRRRAPVDSCVRSVANFCDCRVWAEDSPEGTLRYVFFGLTADVEAARFLHDLIEVTFETETTAFRATKIYLALRGGDRRTATNSFQIGLAAGIRDKLDALKAARTATAKAGGRTGFDLVAVKDSVVEEEMRKLGLNFTTKATSSRRYVLGDAYDAGQAAGARFEPNASLSGN